ncbi:MAG: hypothetical protein FJZ01_20670 [Candidatus Sericytochromatia bacterium]|nr:hypothetical protein [Candidatus Tanganyikabacteria bacterium]
MPSRLLATACACWFLAAAGPAHAGAVKSWGPVDGIGATPLANGAAVLDFRGAAFIPREVHAVTEVALVAGASEWLEIGAVAAAGFQGAIAPSPGALAVDIYPWAKAALPLSFERLKTGLILGGALSGYQSTTETTPGMTALLDLDLGPVLASCNAGYARRLTTGTNIASANLNFTVPAAGFTLYEEQFATYPIGFFTTAGIRGAAIVPVGDKLAIDANLALLYTNAPGQAPWVLSPGFGVSASF